MTCRCGHGRQWHRKAQVSGWQRARGERTTKTSPCGFKVRVSTTGAVVRHTTGRLTTCKCRDWHPEGATR